MTNDTAAELAEYVAGITTATVYSIAAETGLHPQEVARRLAEAAERAAEVQAQPMTS